MASGFSLNGICYASVSEAWTAYSARYPVQDSNGVSWNISGPPTLTPSGFNFITASSDANAVIGSVENSIYLLPCQTEQIQISPDQFYVVFLVACVMFALGFSSTS